MITCDHTTQVLLWFLTICDNIGVSVQTDREFVTALEGPLAAQAEQTDFGLGAYQHAIRSGHRVVGSAKILNNFVGVDDWSSWYTGEVTYE